MPNPETTDAIPALLRDINHRLGLMIVFIIHETDVACDICDNVFVLGAGCIAEQSPIWRIFGNPQYDAIKVLLGPPRGGLPEDVAFCLQPTSPAHAPFEQLVELSYIGIVVVPELAQVTQALHQLTRLLRADLSRIQGRTQRRLLVTAAGSTLPADAPVVLQLS